MKQFVPLDKRSKKEQRAYHAKQRMIWGVLNPVTRFFVFLRSCHNNATEIVDKLENPNSLIDECQCC